jgi:hypothetical protein
MQHIGTHLHRTIQKARETERGELMRYFLSNLNPGRMGDGLPKMTMGHIGKLFEKIPTKDLYYLKRVCSDAPNFSKKFWWEISPKFHTEEALAKSKKAFDKITKIRSL